MLFYLRSQRRSKDMLIFPFFISFFFFFFFFLPSLLFPFSFVQKIFKKKKKKEEQKDSKPAIVVHKNEPMANFDFSLVPPKETAQAMTMVAVEYLKAIPPDEFLQYKCSFS